MIDITFQPHKIFLKNLFNQKFLTFSFRTAGLHHIKMFRAYFYFAHICARSSFSRAASHFLVFIDSASSVGLELLIGTLAFALTLKAKKENKTSIKYVTRSRQFHS